MYVTKLFSRTPHNRHKTSPEESATARRKMKPVYQEKVTSESKTEIYVCLTATEFQARFRDHQLSFNKENRRNDTANTSGSLKANSNTLLSN